METHLRSLVLVLAALAPACGSYVSNGNGSSGAGGSGGEGEECFADCEGSTTTSPTGPQPSPGVGGGGPAAEIAVAMTRAQSDVLWDEYWRSHGGQNGTAVASSGGGGGLDPNDLFIQISNLGVSCGSPTVDLSCGGNWHATLVLPQALQQVGVYDLESPELTLYSSMTETGTLDPAFPEECGWGGGSFGPGILEVVAIDAASVHVKLTANESFWESDPSGDYVASRCP